MLEFNSLFFTLFIARELLHHFQHPVISIHDEVFRTKTHTKIIRSFFVFYFSWLSETNPTFRIHKKSIGLSQVRIQKKQLLVDSGIKNRGETTGPPCFFFWKTTCSWEAFSLWMFLVIATGPRNYPSLRPGAGRWLHRWQPTQCSESLEYGDMGGLCKSVVPPTHKLVGCEDTPSEMSKCPVYHSLSYIVYSLSLLGRYPTYGHFA